MGLIDADAEGLKYEIQEEVRKGARIKVVGVGGGGSNAVARMLHEGMAGVEFFVMNTDAQALDASNVPNKLQIGNKVTSGLGAGANPSVGRQAALEDTEKIIEILQGADMVFVTAGLGGGTGTGAAPVVASLAKELEALTVACVTKPFGFEGPRRMRLANEGVVELASTVDTMIAIPNDRILALVPRGTGVMDAFRVADDVLRQAVQGISDIITTPGLINRDFSDIRATMTGMGFAMVGTAVVRGEKAVIEAARQAIACPLLEDSRIAGSKGVLINITGSSRLGIHEVYEACEIIREAAACEEVQINFGVILNESMTDAVKVTVIATGFNPDRRAAEKAAEARARKPAAEPDIFADRPVVEPLAEPEPEPVAAQPAPPANSPAPQEPGFDPDDLDVPAYLRQRRLIQ